LVTGVRRLAAMIACALATLALPAAASSAYGAPGALAVAHGSAAVSTPPVAFRGFSRPRGFGSRGFGRRPYGYRGRRSHGILRRIIRAIAIGYLLHLLFTTPGGLLVLVMMIALVMALFRRRRRRAYYY
jgi:hypothetical protein